MIAPRFLDIHRISPTHEHIGMIYFARVRGGQTTLAVQEHDDIRWCDGADLLALDPALTGAVLWYARKALEELAIPVGLANHLNTTSDSLRS